MDTGQLVNDPHIQSRQMVVEVQQMLSGPLKMQGSVFKLSATPGDPLVPAPFLGEHYSEEKVEELMAREII